MQFKQPEIESIVDHAVDEIINEVFSGEFNDIEDIDYALNYLKSKIKDLELEDFDE
jgi:hypothetical protein